MKTDVQARWVEDLETTDVPQGKQYLRQWNEETKQWEYCCLGRLCELSGLATWVDAAVPCEDGYSTRIVSSYLGATRCLPEEVADWAGLVKQTIHNTGTAEAHFAELNDDGYSFPDIAAKIPDVLAACNEDE